MPKHIRKSSKQAGLTPGSLVYIGEKRDEKVRIHVLDYNESHVTEKDIKIIEDCYSFRETSTITWINIDGIHDAGIVEKICTRFGVHPLVQEDIMNTTQRAKLENFDKYIFIVMKMLGYDGKTKEIETEQISIILGKNFVISFQEKEGDVFDQIRERIRKSKGRIRKKGPDYLAYALADAIVDNYFSILENIGDDIEMLEDELVSNPTHTTLHKIHALKKEMIFLRKAVWPLREILSGLQREESKLMQKSTEKYIRDVYDHTIQIIDTIETFRDMLSGMIDLYLSSISNKMNEVMKVLTIIATIFMPLSFIAGVYGMNFATDASPLNMPELTWYFGYPAFWLLVMSVASIMVLYFKNKKWL